jgi:hypothetical protein
LDGGERDGSEEMRCGNKERKERWGWYILSLGALLEKSLVVAHHFYLAVARHGAPLLPHHS